MAKGEEVICTRCMHVLPRTDYHTYRNNPLFHRIGGRLPLQFVGAFLLFRKGGIVQELLHELKYNNRPDIGRVLGRVYGYELMKSGYGRQLDMIVPIPLHTWKKKRRGYNQSEEFACGLAGTLQVPVQANVVQRMVNTQTQTRKSRLKRWENVCDVFAVTNRAEVQGKRVLLVDDVITTGATIEACGKALLQAGCTEISVVSIAYSGE